MDNRALRGKAAQENADSTGFHREESSNSEDNKDQAWKSYNLLSLGITVFVISFSDRANDPNGQTAVGSVVIGPF